MQKKSLFSKSIACVTALILCVLSFTACGKLEIKNTKTYAQEIAARVPALVSFNDGL